MIARVRRARDTFRALRAIARRSNWRTAIKLWWTIRGIQQVANAPTPKHECSDAELEPTEDRAGRSCPRCGRYFAGES